MCYKMNQVSVGARYFISLAHFWLPGIVLHYMDKMNGMTIAPISAV